MIPQAINIKPREIWNVFQFMFYTGEQLFKIEEVAQKKNGISVSTKKVFLFYDDSTPRLKEKRASISVFIRAPRSHKNLKLQGEEGLLWNSLYVLPSDKVLIPFNTEEGRGLSIDLFFYLSLEGEQLDKSWKCVPIRNYKTKGGGVSFIDLFRFAVVQQSTENLDSPSPTPLNNNSENVDWVEHKFKNQKASSKYRVERLEDGSFKVQNFSDGEKIYDSSSTKAKAIINFSKFGKNKTK